MTQDKLGRSLRDLRVSLTDRCNFRCSYCMPADGYNKDWKFVPSETLLSNNEIVSLSSLGVSLGASRLRLTGGEPLLHKGVLKLVTQLRNLSGVKELSLTTNGWFLASMANDLQQAGLTRVTVSLDSLDEELFKKISGINATKQGAVARILKGIEAAQAAGLNPVKVNAVIEKGVNENQVEVLAKYFRGSGVVLRFIEYMDVGGCSKWQQKKVFTAADILRSVHKKWHLSKTDQGDGKPSRNYKYVDGKGKIGVVASITKPFCSSCTRARLSADGEWFNCLFSTRGLNLREPLRSGVSEDRLLEMVRAYWQQRTDRYSEQRKTISKDATNSEKVEMHRVGG